MRESPAAFGALILAALVLLVAGLAWLRPPPGATYYADLPEARGLREGALVRFRGVDVGRVERLAFTDAGVRVTLALTRRDVPLRRGAGVRVTPDGVFGEQVAELVPGPEPRAPRLEAGASLPAAPPDTAALRRRAVAESALAAIVREVRAGPAPRDGPPPAAPRHP